MNDVQQAIERALSGGPCSGQQLLDALDISQPTLSRTIRELSTRITMFREPGQRAPQYALLRKLPLGLHPRQRVYRFLSTGNIVPYADLEFLAGGGTLERQEAGAIRLYEGLPPYMLFAAPSGFLGRQLAQTAARNQPFPASLKDWSDDHRIAFLFTQGLNLPGNLIFGDLPLQREMDLMRQPRPQGQDKLDIYVGLAQQLKNESYGSSAGGEQPKFLWVAEDTGSVIVKFARTGSRMAELLPLEHLALASLAEVGVPTAKTQLLAQDEFVFLEVQRFDRVGKQGRLGMLSAGAVDDEFFGARDTWPEFAARCVHAEYLSQQHAEHVAVMAAFSELIGNTDRHFENISLLIGDDGEYLGIAPAYDILPMRYASIGGGLDPELVPIEPKVSTIGAVPKVWSLAARAADAFWEAASQAQGAAPTSAAMRELALRNRAVAREFAAPLLPLMP
ncbi:type II toxin-antitoxin system HipA family toxin YjjJ [Comamonas piscis]